MCLNLRLDFIDNVTTINLTLISNQTLNKILINSSFFSLLFAYFVGGVIFMKFIRHETGAKAIPNVEFWTSIPGNAKVLNENFINL